MSSCSPQQPGYKQGENERKQHRGHGGIRIHNDPCCRNDGTPEGSGHDFHADGDRSKLNGRACNLAQHDIAVSLGDLWHSTTTTRETHMKLSIATMSLALALLAGPLRAAESVEARLAALEDHQSINELVVGAYPRALDEMRLHDYAALFTSDGELILGDVTLKGPARIEKYLSTPGVFDEKPKPGEKPKPPSPPAAPHQVPHIISNPSYRINGNMAAGGAYWTEVAMVNGHAQVVGMGRYKDELRKVNGQWKFARREIIRDVPPEAPRRGAPTGQ